MEKKNRKYVVSTYYHMITVGEYRYLVSAKSTLHAANLVRFFCSDQLYTTRSLEAYRWNGRDNYNFDFDAFVSTLIYLKDVNLTIT